MPNLGGEAGTERSGLGRLPVWVIIGVAFLPGLSAAALPMFVTTAQADGVAGSGWGTPVRLSGTGPSTANAWFLEGPDVAEDFYGNAIAVWGQHDDELFTSGSIWTSRFIPGGGWTAARKLAAGLDGVFAPHVVMAPSGVAFAVWTGNGSIWASGFVPEFLESQRVGWVTPVQTQGGQGLPQRPQLSLDGSGRALVVWEETDGNGTGLWANWFGYDSGWAPPTRIAETAGWIPPQVVISPAAGAFVVWAGPDAMGVERLWATSFDPALGWKAPTGIDGGRCPLSASVATSAAGYVFVVWDEGIRYPDQRCGVISTGPIYAAVLDSVKGWHQAVAGPNGSQPQIVGDEAGGATVLWCEGGTVTWGCGGVVVGRLTSSAGWSISALLADSREARGCCPPKIAVDSFGHTMVVWSHIPEGADLNVTLEEGKLMASHLLPGLGWQLPAAISPTYGARQEIAMNPEGRAFAVWVGFDGNTDLVQWSIWSNRFVPNSDSVSPPAQSVAVDRFLVFGAFILAGCALTLTLVMASYQFLRKKPRRPDGASFSHDNSVEGVPTRRKGWPGSVPSARVASSHGSVLGNAGRDWPKVNGPLRLTTRERILLHLLEFNRYGDSAEVPPGLTQPGISRAAAVDLRHIAQYVRPMVMEGLVRERSAHVRGLVKKHKVYVLADGGRSIAAGVRDRIRSASIRVRDESGVHEATVADALAKRHGRPVLEIVRESIEAGVIDLRGMHWER